MDVYQTFMQGEGAKIADDEFLTEFLNEVPFHTAAPLSLRDRMRKLYRTFCWTYESKCEALLSERAGHDTSDIKKYSGLIHEVESQVVLKLDQLHLGEDQELRRIRKKIINKVQGVLDELEKAKEELVD